MIEQMYSNIPCEETKAERSKGTCPVSMVRKGQSKVENSSQLTPRSMFPPEHVYPSF